MDREGQPAPPQKKCWPEGKWLRICSPALHCLIWIRLRWTQNGFRLDCFSKTSSAAAGNAGYSGPEAVFAWTVFPKRVLPRLARLTTLTPKRFPLGLFFKNEFSRLAGLRCLCSRQPAAQEGRHLYSPAWHPLSVQPDYRLAHHSVRNQ